MKKHIPQGTKSQPATDQSNSEECTSPGGHHHERFPTAEELNALLGDEVSTAIDTELAVMAYERHLMRIARHNTTVLMSHHRDILTIPGWTPGSTLGGIPAGVIPTPDRIPVGAVLDIINAIRTRRVNHTTLDPKARNRFNSALEQAHQAGTYQQLAAIHANTQHRMHSQHGGTQRFLPWHRLYLLRCENLLRTYEPSLRIPYWDYANDQVRPDWVWRPSNVNRGTPGAEGGSLPKQQTVNDIVQQPTYTGFTLALEGNAHNGVHNWCNGTISSPPTAAQDPIFWLLHANVDRIWNLWQVTNNGVPSLNGTDAVLDPWGPTTAINVDSISDLGYWYR